MEFSIATLLSNFTDDKLVAPKVLEKKLRCQDEESLTKLQIALDALEKIGILVKDRGKYRRVQEEDVVEAKLRCSSKGFCFAIQEVEGAEDIYVRESHLSTAWNGDRVLVKVTKEGNRKRSPEGEVRLILERANPSVLARVKQVETGFRAVPLDDRLLFELNLHPNGQNLAEAVDYLVHVEVLRYPLASQPPIGKVARILGSNAEAAADTDIVCCKHDLPRNFPSEVLRAAEELPKQPSQKDFKHRLDLRNLLTLAFIPEPSGAGSENETAQHVTENALTLNKTEAGAWQLGVHITDVAHYIEPQEALDREARKRGNTVYLGDMVLPMLPDAVASRCSLVPGEARLAISVLLTLDSATGQMVEYEIQPTVIQVDRQLSYDEATAILERHQDAEAPVFEMLSQLFYELSPAVKAQRLGRGGFELNLPGTQLPYNDEGILGAIVFSGGVRSLVVELMLLANQAIATHLQALFLPATYRIQPSPDPEDVQELMKLASNLGMELRLEQEEAVTSRDYQRFTQMFAQSQSERVLMYLLQSTLRPCGYSTAPGSHFGLALGIGEDESPYTHCLSPLRRYADLLMSRVLLAVFEKGRDRRTTRAKESVNLRHSSAQGNINWNVLPPDVQEDLESQLQGIVVHLNEREKLTSDAQADLEGLKKAELMKERTGEVFQGLITGVQSYGFFVEIEDLLVEGLVHVSSLKDDWYEFRSRHACLVGRKSRVSYRLGDRVEVQVKSVDYYRQQIDLVIVGGGSEASNEDIEADPSVDPEFDE
ncbi:ribonuclease R [Trichocoleus sp. ST-U3]|uniref:ribonuclease R family protein n=1 Tax=Coleofasciculus sp. FACHB-542 TaxID=2692787 RepID=UPI00168609B4|nr:ribonuclease R family protein [Coleofasciculus sp. FACHB-542]MBD2084915.1 VacB/RNase II family 3'-5' exoribonuclease [Coleofasciculus sp. FACHB-542]